VWCRHVAVVIRWADEPASRFRNATLGRAMLPGRSLSPSASSQGQCWLFCGEAGVYLVKAPVAVPIDISQALEPRGFDPHPRPSMALGRRIIQPAPSRRTNTPVIVAARMPVRRMRSVGERVPSLARTSSTARSESLRPAMLATRWVLIDNSIRRSAAPFVVRWRRLLGDQTHAP